jgi:hypothetical protein
MNGVFSADKNQVPETLVMRKIALTPFMLLPGAAQRIRLNGVLLPRDPK